jgi:hypothetical protein
VEKLMVQSSTFHPTTTKTVEHATHGGAAGASEDLKLKRTPPSLPYLTVKLVHQKLGNRVVAETRRDEKSFLHLREFGILSRFHEEKNPMRRNTKNTMQETAIATTTMNSPLN